MILTGFKGYGGRGINPAEEIIKALDGKVVAGATVSGRVLPVAYRGLREQLRDIVAEAEAEPAIALGLWPGESLIRLERLAVNVNAFEIPDNEGTLENGPVVAGGTLAYPATLPLEEIQARLLSADIPARLSSSAGNFLCNATMYYLLEAVAQGGVDIPCGFIHVPYLPVQVAEIIKEDQSSHAIELHQRADLASMSLEVMVKAVRIAIETAIEHRR